MQDFPRLPDEDEGSREYSSPYTIQYSPVDRRVRIRTRRGQEVFVNNVRRQRNQSGDVRYVIDGNSMSRDEAQRYFEERANAEDFVTSQVGEDYTTPNLFTEPARYFGEGLPRQFGFGGEAMALSARASNLYNRIAGAPGGGRGEVVNPQMVSQVQREREAAARPARA